MVDLVSRVRVQPSRLRGEIRLPPSKSETHRAVLSAALSGGISRIWPILPSQDIQATCDAVQALGAKITQQGDALLVDGRGMFDVKNVRIDCRESGSTLRFMLPLAAAGGIGAVFTGEGRLPQRPIGEYIRLLEEHGVHACGDAVLPLTLSGKLRPGVYCVPGDVSSQTVSGLLFALPLLDGDSEIRLTSPLQSAGYVEMTLHTLRRFGVCISMVDGGFQIRGNQRYVPCEYEIEGDWSQAAFFFLAGALSGDVCIGPLRADSAQGDRRTAALFEAFGARVSRQGNVWRVQAAPLKALEIDASQIPDLVPALSIAAGFAHGTTCIHSAARLRLKESDRLAACSAGLHRLGVQVNELPDALEIKGGAFPGDRTLIDGCGDHRIVMAFCMASCGFSHPLTITDAQAVAKSYPHFFDDFKKLGGNCDVLNDG